MSIHVKTIQQAKRYVKIVFGFTVLALGRGDDRYARSRLAGNTLRPRNPGGGVCLGAPAARPAEKRGPANSQRRADAPACRPVVRPLAISGANLACSFVFLFPNHSQLWSDESS